MQSVICCLIGRWIYVSLWINSLTLLGEAACPNDGVILADGVSCYWITTDVNNPALSDAKCKEDDGRLANIPNEQINSELTGSKLSRENINIWIGVNDKNEENMYEDVAGSLITWSNWADGEPNDPNHSSFPSQDCVYVQLWESGKWFDNFCTSRRRALCHRRVEIITTTKRTTIPTTTTSTTTTTTVRTTTVPSTTTTTPTTTTVTTTTIPSTATTSITTSKTSSIRTITSTMVNSTLFTSNMMITSLESSPLEQTSIFESTDNITRIKMITAVYQSTSELSPVNLAQIIIPVVIAGVVIAIGLLLIIFVLRRRRKNANQKYRHSVMNEAVNPPYDIATMENIKSDITYGDIAEGEYDMLNKKRTKALNDKVENLYDHTNIQEDTYDVTGPNKTNTVDEHYDGVALSKNTKTTPNPGNYDKVDNKNKDMKTETGHIVIIDRNYGDQVYYSSAKDTGSGTNYGDQVYYSSAKDAGYQEDTYGETTEGEYDILNQRRKKQNNPTEQIYSHTDTDEDTYDETKPGQNTDKVDNDTYDHFRNVNSGDNLYDHAQV